MRVCLCVFVCVYVLLEYKYNEGGVYFLPLPHPSLFSFLFVIGVAFILYGRCIFIIVPGHLSRILRVYMFLLVYHSQSSRRRPTLNLFRQHMGHISEDVFRTLGKNARHYFAEQVINLLYMCRRRNEEKGSLADILAVPTIPR